MQPDASTTPDAAVQPTASAPAADGSEPEPAELAARADALPSPTPVTSGSAASPAGAPADARGAPHTVHALAAEMVQQLGQRVSRFEVALNPMGLGRVDVALQIGAQGRISATLAFDRPGSAAELKSRAGELEGALRDAGFDVRPGDLSFTQLDAALTGDGGGRRASQQFADAEARREAGGSTAARAFGAASDRADPPAYRSSRAARGLDIQV